MSDMTARRLLEALEEPALVLGKGGVVELANRAAMQRLGDDQRDLVGSTLSQLTVEPPEQVAALLRRCRGSGQTVFGTVRLAGRDGNAVKYQWRGCRMGTATVDQPAAVLLRFFNLSQDKFRTLTSTVVALNEEIRHNKRHQMQLRTALAQSRTLLKELHHRVKNNLQVLLSMLAIAERSAPREARTALQDARLRVEAIAVIQRLLYQKEDLSGIDGRAFLRELCAHIERLHQRPEITVEVIADTVHLSLDAASIVGLMVNELLTNAFKYAFDGRAGGRVAVHLSEQHASEGGLVLVVEDDGTGFRTDKGFGTGLRLVQGLAHQLGGDSQIESRPGVRCFVRFRDRITTKVSQEQGRAMGTSCG